MPSARRSNSAHVHDDAGVALRRGVGERVGDGLPDARRSSTPVIVPVCRALSSGRRQRAPIRTDVSGAGLGARRSLAARAASISLTAPHIDSIHHVAPASAQAAGECSVALALDDDVVVAVADVDSRIALICGRATGAAPPPDLREQAVPAQRPGHRLRAAERRRRTRSAPAAAARCRRSSGTRSAATV